METQLDAASAGQIRNERLIIGGLFVRSSHRPDGDHSVQGFTVFDFASVCFDADKVSEVLKVEEQQVIPKVQERQTLRGEKTLKVYVDQLQVR